ncbi:MAG: histidine phosphatase family protein [Candidatus Rhabdochlamydia sp.]
MKIPIRKTPFYFLRHAQTDHSIYQLYDDPDEVQLNEKGIKQALEIQSILAHLPITTVCSSPLLRVQQTKEIALKNKIFKDIILEDLRECPSMLWDLFYASELRSLTIEEWELVQEFIYRVERGLKQAFQQEDPLLLIAHGGTYWALYHLLQLEGNQKINNCILVEFFLDQQNTWKTKFIS